MDKLFIILVFVCLLISCSKKKASVYENDADFHEWTNAQTIKNVQHPHSGFSVSIIDSAHIYSLGFNKTIENISNNKFTEVEFSYWVFIKSDKAKFSSVISIDFNGQNIDWSGKPAVTKDLNKWVEIHETFKISSNARPNNQLSLYVLNESKEEILVDDLKVKFCNPS